MARLIQNLVNRLSGKKSSQRAPQRHAINTVSMGQLLPGIDLNKANELAGRLEDEEHRRKMIHARAL